MSAPIRFPDLDADVLFDKALPADCIRTTSKRQSVHCLLISGGVRLKVLVLGERWRSVPVGVHSPARIYCMGRRIIAAEHFQRGDSFELWAESRIGSGIVLATHHPDDDAL